MHSVKPNEPRSQIIPETQDKAGTPGAPAAQDRYLGSNVVGILRRGIEYAGEAVKAPVLATSDSFRNSLSPHVLEFDGSPGSLTAMKIAAQTKSSKWAKRISLDHTRLNRPLTDEEFADFIKLINENINLRDLRIKSLELTPAQKNTLVTALQRHGALERLEIEGGILEAGPLVPEALTVEQIGLHRDSNPSFAQFFPNLKILKLTRFGLRGEPDFTKLPRRLQSLVLQNNEFTGTPDLTGLPSDLGLLDISQNKFTGTPVLTRLPTGLKDLRMGSNEFTGTPDLTGLPSDLVLLDIGQNKFTGTPVLTRLPADLVLLDIGQNKFTGTPVLTRLPAGLKRLSMGFNQFAGAPDLTNLPPGLASLYISGNQFTGTPDLTGLPPRLRQFDISNNQFTGIPDLTKLPPNLKFLDISGNQFIGTPDLTRLPAGLFNLRMGFNQFTGVLDLVKLPGRYFPNRRYFVGDESNDFAYVDRGDGEYTGWTQRDPAVRIATIEAAAKNLPEHAREKIRELLQTETDPNVREAAATKLAELINKDADEILRDYPVPSVNDQAGDR
jgi:Leucine-rich repeat (LRR) protein